MFPIMLWGDLGNIYFSVAVLSSSSSPTDVVRSCSVFCLSANNKKILTCCNGGRALTTPC